MNLACRILKNSSLSFRCSCVRLPDLFVPNRSMSQTGKAIKSPDDPNKTMQDMADIVKERMKDFFSLSNAWNMVTFLRKLPSSQKDLPPRRMKDSYDTVLIPIGTDVELREKYLTIHKDGIRIGRLMEDIDIFAGWITYKYLQEPTDRTKLPPPYSVVTALVDHVDFEECLDLKENKDLKLEGHVSWVGTSSAEISIDVLQEVRGSWTKITKAVIVMAARNPGTGKSAPINPLVCETEDEIKIQLQGESRNMERRQKIDQDLFTKPPNMEEQDMVHHMLMQLATPEQLSYSLKKPENSVWMSETKLKNLIICFPENRNTFNKIFGGFLMRQAIELSYANASVYSGQKPKIIHIDDILFKRPVEIGSLLYLNSQVVYTEGSHMQISTKASVLDAKKQSVNLTNNLHLTFEVPDPVQICLPHSYNEAMMYINGRRRYKSVRGLSK